MTAPLEGHPVSTEREAMDALNRLHTAAQCAAADEDSFVASTEGGGYSLSSDYQIVVAALAAGYARTDAEPVAWADIRPEGYLHFYANEYSARSMAEPGGRIVPLYTSVTAPHAEDTRDTEQSSGDSRK